MEQSEEYRQLVKTLGQMHATEFYQPSPPPKPANGHTRISLMKE